MMSRESPSIGEQGAATPSLFAGLEDGAGEQPAVAGLPRDLPASWLRALEPETRKPYWSALMQFVADERAAHPVLPPEADVFNAFRFTPLDRVDVVLSFLAVWTTFPSAHSVHRPCVAI